MKWPDSHHGKKGSLLLSVHIHSLKCDEKTHFICSRNNQFVKEIRKEIGVTDENFTIMNDLYNTEYQLSRLYFDVLYQQKEKL